MKLIKSFLVLALVLSAMACKSNPPPAFVPDDTMRQALEAAKEDAEKQRKLAQDFGGPEFFADEYRQAESLNTEAGGLPLGNAGDYTTATEKYTALAAAYRQISDKSLPRFFEGKAQAAKDAHEKSVNAGAGQKDVWEDDGGQLAAADEAATSGLGLFEAKDYYAARDAYDGALSRYEIIETEALCYVLKAEIDQYQLHTYDAESFAGGEESLGNAAAAYDQKDLPAAKNAAAAALSSYQTTAEKGWEGLAEVAAGQARTQEGKVQDIKGHVAMKDEFEAAQAMYTQGEEAGSGREFKQAYNTFLQSETMFASIYDLVLKQRQSADSLIKEADKQVGASAQRARDVQQQITGGKK